MKRPPAADGAVLTVKRSGARRTSLAVSVGFTPVVVCVAAHGVLLDSVGCACGSFLWFLQSRAAAVCAEGVLLAPPLMIDGTGRMERVC